MLFCCNYNSVRSPMAEGIFKKLIGRNLSSKILNRKKIEEIGGMKVRQEMNLVKVLDKENAKLISKNSKTQTVLVKNKTELSKYFKRNLINDEIIIGMGAGLISQWMKDLKFNL